MKSKFSACYGGSLPGTEKICSWTEFRVIHEQILQKSCPLVILQGTKAADRISEIAIFRNGISEICQRSYASWSSYLLGGYKFHVRGLCSLFVNEIHTKLTRNLVISGLATGGSSDLLTQRHAPLGPPATKHLPRSTCHVHARSGGSHSGF